MYRISDLYYLNIDVSACSVLGLYDCDGGHCIPRDYLCDGIPQCTDDRDEDGCSVKSNSGYFTIYHQ